MERRVIRALLGLLAVVGVATPALGQTGARDRIAVSVEWLASHLNDPDLVILHSENAAGYGAAHIKGARLVTGKDITAPHSDSALSTEFADDRTLEEQLETLGVSDRSTVVVVAGGDYTTSSMRVLSTLYYAGLGDRARWLDGGLTAWIAAGKPVTTEVPPARKGELTLHPVRGFVVDADFVQSHAGKAGYAVIDARGESFYTGTREGEPGKLGHIPGARSLGVTEVYTDDGHLKPTSDLQALFTNAGVRRGDVVVAYCHIGVYANSILTAARILGYEVRLYDGSFQDWARRNLPLATKP